MLWRHYILWIAAGGLFLSPARADVFSAAQDMQVIRKAGYKTDGASLLEYLKRRTLTREGQDKLDRLVRQLGSRSYRVRRDATAGLREWGTVALPALQAALKESDPEVARRADFALHQIKARDLGPEVTAAVIRLATRRNPDGTAAALLAFLPFAETDVVAEEVRAGLTQLAKKDGQADPVLVAALKDSNPPRRGAAAEALCRAGLADQVPAVRPLLRDADPEVRFRVARALALSRDKKAIPVLIAGLDRWPAREAYRALDFLYRVADDGAPHRALGATKEARGKCRAAWEAWWKKHGDRLDLARLAEKPRLKEYTVLLLIDQGKMLERDAAGKERWHFDGLEQPLDMQLLPGDRVLVAEHRGGHVTERTFKGEILWETKAEDVLMAQRLPNGNTFIATRARLFEVDPTGKEVAELTLPEGGQVMKAARLPSGEVACVVLPPDQTMPHFFRLSTFGKKVASFPVRLNTSGGRIEVLPGGGILVPEMAYNRVVEYDGEGRITWQAQVEEPIAAVRLANGNTLVTTYSQHRAVELNRLGREVAEFTGEGRVNRALRR